MSDQPRNGFRLSNLDTRRSRCISTARRTRSRTACGRDRIIQQSSQEYLPAAVSKAASSMASRMKWVTAPLNTQLESRISTLPFWHHSGLTLLRKSYLQSVAHLRQLMAGGQSLKFLFSNSRPQQPGVEATESRTTMNSSSFPLGM